MSNWRYILSHVTALTLTLSVNGPLCNITFSTHCVKRRHSFQVRSVDINSLWQQFLHNLREIFRNEPSILLLSIFSIHWNKFSYRKNFLASGKRDQSVMLAAQGSAGVALRQNLSYAYEGIHPTFEIQGWQHQKTRKMGCQCPPPPPKKNYQCPHKNIFKKR